MSEPTDKSEDGDAAATKPDADRADSAPEEARVLPGPRGAGADLEAAFDAAAFDAAAFSEAAADDAPPKEAKVVRVDFRARVPAADPHASEKFAVFSRFAEKGKVMVTLDARRPGVSVPTRFAEDPQLNLDFSVRFGLADFAFDARGVRASLSFQRQPFFCDLPWSAVYALYSHVDNERLTWARSLPREILDQLPEASLEHLERVRELQVERLLRNAREQREQEIKAERPAPPAPSPSSPPAGEEAPRRGGLRLVKSDTRGDGEP